VGAKDNAEVIRRGYDAFNAGDLKLQSLVASDDLVVGLHRNQGERAGKTLAIGVALVFRLEDQKIVEAWEHYDDMYAWDDFWA
jgi:uncharacterized protein